jgi:hypothetical protein
VQLNRQGPPTPPNPRAARNTTTFAAAHVADESAAETDLAAYYTRELHLPDAAAAAHAAVGELVDKAFASCL